MKKVFKSLAMLTFASALFLTSCSEDKEVDPVKVTVSGSPSDKTLTLGTKLKLTLQLAGNDDNKLKKVSVASNKTSAAILSKELSGTTATEVVDIDLTQTGNWVITITVDGSGSSDAVTSSYEVTVTAPSSYKGLDLGGAEILLGAQSSAVGQFVNLQAGTIFEYGNGAAKNNAAQIDLGFAFGTGAPATRNAASLFGPSHTAYHNAIYTDATNGIAKWAVKNATKIVKLTAVTEADYEAATTDSILIHNASKFASATENRVTKLEVGDVLLFETGRNIGAGPKKGLILITDIDVKPSSGSSEGQETEIKFKRKIEQQ